MSRHLIIVKPHSSLGLRSLLAYTACLARFHVYVHRWAGGCFFSCSILSDCSPSYADFIRAPPFIGARRYALSVSLPIRYCLPNFAQVHMRGLSFGGRRPFIKPYGLEPAPAHRSSLSAAWWGEGVG